MAYEALYRRYRPSRFQDAFFGQEHVVAALRNAIEGDRVGHAYLFSGPRGTGKTTSARILAKALNCTNLQDGEPCNECDSCQAFQSGGSYDLHELDAASNNGVEAMRDLIGKVALGSPGRTKVYILDEVHMLSSGAENALLKTLEEPPAHVVFVLCTTEPNKVVATIRSRTQHLEFSLLSASQVGELIDYVIGDAGIEITPEDRQYVIRAGGGSARDTLSALDQVVAAGGAPQGGEHLEALFQALIDRDAPVALAAIDGAMQAGRDPAQVGASLLHELRTVFLAAMRADLGHLPEAERERATARAANMPPARVTRAIEVIGTSLIEMRQAPDPRVDLEVAIMRLTRVDLDTDPAALVERLEAIESQLSGGAANVPPLEPRTMPAQPAVAEPHAPPIQEPRAEAQASPANDPAPVEAPGQPGQSEPYAERHYAEPSPQPPQQQAPPQAAPAPAAGGGRRGAAIARAELERQGFAPSKPTAAAAPPESPPVQAEPVAPVSSGKTLADVRRERQAAAQAADQGGNTAEVEANAAARRERQAAAQAEPTERAHSAPAQSVPAAQPGPAPVEHVAPQPQQAPPAQAPQPGPAPVEHAAPQPQAAPSTQAPPVQTPPTQGPPPEAAPAPQATAEAPAPGPGPEVAPAAEPAPAAPAPAPAAAGALPTLDEINGVWSTLLGNLSNRVKSRFAAGHFVEATADTLQFGLPNPVHRDRCEEIRDEVDQALAAQFGRPLPLALVVDMVEDEPDFFAAPPSGGAGAVDEAEAVAFEEESVDVHSLVDATDDVPSAEDRVMATFENSVLLEDPSNQHPNQ